MKTSITKNLAARLSGIALGLATLAATAQTAATFGNLPLYFEAGAPDRFVAQGKDAQFSVAANGAQLTLQKSGVARTVQMQFTGANPQPQIQGDGGLSGRINYLTGSQPAQWRTGVPTFARVQVTDLYPGIDLVYYGNQQRLEYDFTLAPGVHPGAIAMRFSGADEISVDARGELVLKLGHDEMRQPRPVIYQTVDGVRREISGGYKMLDAHNVAFTVGNYDRARPLVIDPVLDYSTYFGGTDLDTAWSVAVSATDGSVYVAGQTLSEKAIKKKKDQGEFIKGAPFSTPGAMQEEFAGGKLTGDGFVARFDNTGTNLIYLTYLGGSVDEFVSGVVVDTNGNAFVTGWTESPDFPTTNALYPNINGVVNKKTKRYAGDAFVAELDAGGSNLVFSTYLGGSGLDAAYGIALDLSGNIYVAGGTASTNYPVLNPVAFQLIGSTNLVLNRLAGTNNAFVTKIGAGGSPLIYSTYLGGVAYDVAESIAVDAAGSAMVAGFTISSNFPTLNAISSELNEGGDKKNNDNNSNPNKNIRNIAFDAFVTKLSPAGNSLVYSTFLGSTNNDVAYRIASDATGNAYVTGYSASPNFPYTVTNIPGFYSIVASNKNGNANNANGESDAFLTKFDPTGALVYSAMFGGKGTDIGFGVAVDPLGDAFVVGTTTSKDFPTNNTASALSDKRIGNTDIFVTALNSDASAVLYSGYFGGKKVDNGYSIAVDAAGSVFITGQTFSKDYPLTNAFQPFRNGKADAVLSKISLP
ncbi:MAG TPA: SBBP repeat-containing protein [Verrucomicrobiae bacterium]|nr:SBBP repeat-containing protein [Verrucomicrobiae bacterium]